MPAQPLVGMKRLGTVAAIDAKAQYFSDTTAHKVMNRKACQVTSGYFSLLLFFLGNMGNMGNRLYPCGFARYPGPQATGNRGNTQGAIDLL